MRFSQPLFLVFVLCSSYFAKGQTEEQIVNGKRFTVPQGCVIELVATTPLIDRPINCDFDSQGRLYVTESSGTNENVNQQLQKKPHRIIRLEDSDGDGSYDKRTVFADKMMFQKGQCGWTGRYM